MNNVSPFFFTSFFIAGVNDGVDPACTVACPNACEQVSYDSETSYSNLVSEHTLDGLIEKLQSLTFEDVDVYKLNITASFIKNNIVVVQMGYSNLRNYITTSTPAQSISGFISDLGGQLGLFAGISLITICEIIEYPLIKLAAFYKARTMPSSIDVKSSVKL